MSTFGNCSMHRQGHRTGLPYNWKYYRNKAAAQSVLGDLRKMILEEPDSPKNKSLAAKDKSVLLVAFACIL